MYKQLSAVAYADLCVKRLNADVQVVQGSHNGVQLLCDFDETPSDQVIHTMLRVVMDEDATVAEKYGGLKCTSEAMIARVAGFGSKSMEQGSITDVTGVFSGLGEDAMRARLFSFLMASSRPTHHHKLLYVRITTPELLSMMSMLKLMWGPELRGSNKVFPGVVHIYRGVAGSMNFVDMRLMDAVVRATATK